MITVVIPTHNRLAYLKEAVASAHRQRPESPAIVVIDDGSADDTSAWLATDPYPGLRWARTDPPAGGSAARNRGLAMVTTPYVMFLDDDDVLRPTGLAVLRAALDRAPEAAAAAGSYQRFGDGVRPRREIHPRVAITTRVWREVLLNWNMPPCTVLWRTAVVRSIGGWDESLRRCEDRDLTMRADPRPFALVPTVVADYRVHATQVPGSVYAGTDDEIRQRFVDRLDGDERATAEAIVAARPRFNEAVDQFARRQLTDARRGFASVLHPRTRLAWSPVLGPWLLGMLAKSTVASLLPKAVRPRESASEHAANGLE